MEMLFVYGTLRDKNIEKQAIGREINGNPDSLEGYEKKIIMIRNEPYPIIFPNKDSSVHGLVLEVTEDELKKIDEYESDIYIRKRVVLKSGSKAWAYVERKLP